ncbi:hypothetical protein SESBI_26214 [Sesbania bispinosa]|nr:hypothetical protein SESBI_26214 [Sesbania bispinosa]
MVCTRMEARVERLEKLIEEERSQERSDRESFESWVERIARERIEAESGRGAVGFAAEPSRGAVNLEAEASRGAERWRKLDIPLFSGKDTDAEFLKSIFLNGLKEEVRAKLRLHQWRSLPEMMDLAQRADERNRALQRTTGVGYGRGNIIKNYPISRTITVEAGRKTYSSSGTPSLGTAKESTNTQPANNLRVKGGSFKKLSNDELNERQKKGLCFNCDEKFGPNHVCKNKRYQIMILEEDENEPGEEEGETEVEEMECQALQLSLNSMTGFTSKRSIIALGEIKGDGRKIQGRGKCSQLGLQLQGWRIQQDFFIFDLGGAEVVLGMEWLASLGDIRANFQELTLMIPRKGGTMVLKGDPSLSRTAASFRSIMKAIHEDGLGFFLTCAEVFEDHQQREELPPDSNIHPVFHVSSLKRAVAPTVVVQPLRPGLTAGFELQVTPAAVLVIRNTLKFSFTRRVCQLVKTHGNHSV